MGRYIDWKSDNVVKPAKKRGTGNSARSTKKLNHFVYDNKSNSTSLVESELIGKYIGFGENEISMNDFKWRRLHGPNIRDNVLLNLNEGFDSSIDYFLSHGISSNRTLKYIMETTAEGTSLKEAVHGSEFVASRGTLVHIASNHVQVDYRKPKLYGEFVFTKFEDVIFICSIVDTESQDKQQKGKYKKKYYWVNKFNYKMTTENLETDSDLEKFTLPCPIHFGVFKTQVTDLNGHSTSFFISGKIDGQDRYGKFIETRQQHFGLTLKKPWHNPEPTWFSSYKDRWWIQGALSNTERIIVGLHDGDGIVKKIKEIRMCDMRNAKKQWKPEDCIDLLWKTCEDARKMLNNKPERSFLKCKLFSNRKEPVMTWIEDDDRDNYEFLSPEFIERFSTVK